MLEPPPPPPRHPSTRAPSPPPRPRSPRPAVPPRPRLEPSGTDAPRPDPPQRLDQAAQAPTSSTGPVVEVEHPSPTAHDAVDQHAPPPPVDTDDGTAMIPPRHPKTARFSSPLPSPRLSPPPSPPPLRGGGTLLATERKLRDLEDQDTLDLLERVADQLTDVRLAGHDRGDVVYPSKADFSDDDGHLDYLGYGLAYLATAALDYTPPGLVAPPPPSTFSFRALRSDLERLYVLCPPRVWQRFLFGTFSSLWRWEDPRRTATWLAAYLALCLFDLVLVVPFALLVLYLVKAHWFPPSTEELLARAADRRSRTRDAAELGKQLSASNRFGLLAGEGVRGLWTEVRERLSRDDAGDDDDQAAKSLAAALGPGAALGGGIAGGASAEPILRQRRRAESSANQASTSPLARGLGSGAGVLGAAGAPNQVQLDGLRPDAGSAPGAEGGEDETEDPEYDPARGGPQGDGELSLYRLVRHLVSLLGPQAMIWCAEGADVAEMVKNVLAHPDHPASRAVALRFAFVCVVLLVTPTWVVYKSIWLFLGLEVFVLWRVRELYPDWRRATISYWWLLNGAPTDVEYALFVLRQRSLTDRPLKGAKTLRRSRASSSATSVKSASGAAVGADQGSTRAVARRAGRALLRRANGATGEEVLLANGESEAVLSSYFAMHASAPGFLRLSRSTILFTPSRRLKRLGKLASRFTGADPDPDPTLDLDLGSAGDDDASFASAGTGSTVRQQGEVQIAVDEIASVRKGTRMRAFEGLVVTTREGKVWRFANVARRDAAFNKLLSLSSARWEQA
ncbi:hypothetical protein JCM8208_004031 [Rhodotorula glutinis]